VEHTAYRVMVDRAGPLKPSRIHPGREDELLAESPVENHPIAHANNLPYRLAQLTPMVEQVENPRREVAFRKRDAMLATMRLALSAATSAGSNIQPRASRAGCRTCPSIFRIGKTLRYPSSAATWALVSHPSRGLLAFSGCFSSGLGFVMVSPVKMRVHGRLRAAVGESSAEISGLSRAKAMVEAARLGSTHRRAPDHPGAAPR
jgi:hypothetical protein